MNFSENLHFVMESRGILIKELSQITGISENTLKTYLRTDYAEPTLSKAALIAGALDVSLDFLANGEDVAARKLPTNMRNLLLATQGFSDEEFHILLSTAKAIRENKGMGIV